MTAPCIAIVLISEPLGRGVDSHTRRVPRVDFIQCEDASALFFDEARVPVEAIAVANPEIECLTIDQYDVVGERTGPRLAQRSGSYVILKCLRPVIKHRARRAA